MTLSLIPTAETMYTLQFDLKATNGPGSRRWAKPIIFKQCWSNHCRAVLNMAILIPPAMVGSSSNLVSLLLNNLVNLLEVG